MRFLHRLSGGLLLVLLCSGCTCRGPRIRPDDGSRERPCFANPVLPAGSSPCLVSALGRYYYLQSSYTRISIWSAESIAGLKDSPDHPVYVPGEKYYISAPQMVSLDGKWYIYYSCEGLDMSSRQIHVLENASADPLEGEFVHKAVLRTGGGKAVHPFPFSHRGRRYLLWSDADESGGIITRNCICIAEMETPWRLSSRRRTILGPRFEWECQWKSDNYPAKSTPTYVNEAPVVIPSRDSSKLLLYFAASQTYTPYYCEGLAWAEAGDDPTDSRSWHKLSEPVFGSDDAAQAFGAGHLSFYRDADDSLYFLYQAYSGRTLNRLEDRSPRMQRATWGADGLPVLGKPLSLETEVEEPRLRQ